MIVNRPNFFFSKYLFFSKLYLTFIEITDEGKCKARIKLGSTNKALSTNYKLTERKKILKFIYLAS